MSNTNYMLELAAAAGSFNSALVRNRLEVVERSEKWKRGETTMPTLGLGAAGRPLFGYEPYTNEMFVPAATQPRNAVMTWVDSAETAMLTRVYE